MAEIELEEDEYTSQITGKTLGRILGLTKPHRRWVVGFWTMIAFTSILDALFTYLNKGIIDQGIIAQKSPGSDQDIIFIRRIDPGSIGMRLFIHFPGRCVR